MTTAAKGLLDALASALQEESRLSFSNQMIVAHTLPVVLGFLAFTAVEACPRFDKYKIQPSQQVNALAMWLRARLFPGSRAVEAPSSSRASTTANVATTSDREVQKTTRATYWRCVVDNIVTHVVVVPAMVCFVAFPVARALSPAAVDTTQPLPSVATILLQVGFFVLVEDALFYWSHRLLHVPWIYPYMHKKHHEFRAPITLTAEYAHPVEKLLGNHLPVVTGPLLWPCHPTILALWLALRMCKTIEAHSGYAFPWSPFSFSTTLQTTSRRHDFHHSNNRGCFGSFLRFWDWACGTEGDYIKEAKRQQAMEKAR